MTGRLDISEIRRQHPIPGIAGVTLKLERRGSEWKACCPFHDERTPSFTIYAGGERFQCFGCGAQGDVLDFVRALHGVSLREAAGMLSGGDLPTIEVVPMPGRDDGDRLAKVREIWRSAGPARGTPAEEYLRSRALDLTIPESLRFAMLTYGRRGPQHPCLVACVASPDDRLCGIQRTYLASDGKGKAAVTKPKLSLGRVSGGAIRLAPAAGDLVVCEGLEDGLTLQQQLGQAVWVSAGTANLPKMQFPPIVRSIAIGGDADDAGRAAAEKAAEAFASRGLKVRTFFPAGAKDFNAELMEASR